MFWHREVDEDANGWIDWENFVQLYIRCRKDRSVCDFLIHIETENQTETKMETETNT